MVKILKIDLTYWKCYSFGREKKLITYIARQYYVILTTFFFVMYLTWKKN